MAASFSLIIEDDAGKQIVVPFAKDVITIGRKEGNTIRLTERNVSRFHAKLEKQPTGVLVEDLSSFNGVKLNGDRIAGKVLVTAGDVIEIGDYHLELRAAQAAKAAAQAQAVGPIGSKAGALQDNAPLAGDEFEGDTQRWDPPAGAGSPSVHPTQEDTMPHMPAGGGFADGAGDTERLDLQHLQSLASQGGQTVPPPQSLGEAQSWPPPPGMAAPPPRPAAPPPQPMFGPGDLEPTARQPVANVPLGGNVAGAPPPPSSSASFSAGPSLHEPTQDLPMPSPASPPKPAPSPTSSPASQPPQPKPRRAAEETEQLRAAPSAVNPADDVSIPRLVVLNTIFSGSTFPLKAMENVLGRTDDNDIVLEHRSVSRNHAKLVREGERVRILDLKSANGVLVNGEECEQQVLKGGDVIELGRLKLRFVPVGERFAVSPEEIERSRIQDAQGDDAYDDSAQTVNVTSPLRAPRPADGEPPTVTKKPIALYAVLAGLAVVVVILAIVVISGGKETPTDPTPTPSSGTPVEPTPVGALPTTTPDPLPTPPTEVKTPPTPPTEVRTPPTPPLEPPLEPVELTPTKTDTPKTTTPKKKDKEIDFEGQLREAQQAIMKGDFKEAVPLLKELEKVNGADPRIHRNLGISYARLRDNAQATKHYKKYLELNPTAPDADKVREILSKNK